MKQALSLLLLCLLGTSIVAERSALQWNGHMRYYRHPRAQLDLAATGPTGKAAPKAATGKATGAQGAAGVKAATGPKAPSIVPPGPSSIVIQSINGPAKIQLKGRTPNDAIKLFAEYPPDLKLVSPIGAVPAGEKTLIVLLPNEAQFNHTYKVDTERERAGYVYVIDSKRGDQDTFITEPAFVSIRCNNDGQFEVQVRGNVDKHSSIKESRFFEQNKVQPFDIDDSHGCFGVRSPPEPGQETVPASPDSRPDLGFCVTSPLDKPLWIASLNKIAGECKPEQSEDESMTGDRDKILKNALDAIRGKPEDEIMRKQKENAKILANMQKALEIKKREMEKSMAELIAQKRLQEEEAARKKKELEAKEKCIKETLELRKAEEEAERLRAEQERQEEEAIKQTELIAEQATQLLSSSLAAEQSSMAANAQQSEAQLQAKQAELTDLVKKNFLGNSAGDYAVCTRPTLFAGPAMLSQSGKELCIQLQSKSLGEAEIVNQCASMNTSSLCDLCCGSMTGDQNRAGRDECKQQCTNAAANAQAMGA